MVVGMAAESEASFQCIDAVIGTGGEVVSLAEEDSGDAFTREVIHPGPGVGGWKIIDGEVGDFVHTGSIAGMRHGETVREGCFFLGKGRGGRWASVGWL